MNQAELIAKIAETIDFPKATVKAVLDAAAGEVSAELLAGGEVALPGLGKFSTKTRAARTGRNPLTGAAVDIPAKRVPAFAATKSLKDAVAL